MTTKTVRPSRVAIATRVRTARPTAAASVSPAERAASDVAASLAELEDWYAGDDPEATLVMTDRCQIAVDEVKRRAAELGAVASTIPGRRGVHLRVVRP